MHKLTINLTKMNQFTWLIPNQAFDNYNPIHIG
ncbi:hypothetical protein F383_03007 [Gossypium arboreum]|uniref:Uncharacterized protein n=1 Tax=Gossypium arboreum TaxID=29729 RepID=A0A0B0PWU2_GOSAR|nr:hypothetical protein F383_03007 [Gossypium arboreum]